MVGTPPGAQPSPFQTTAPVSPFNTTVFGSSLGNGPGLAGPGSLPPYLGGSSNAGERISSHSFSKSISDFTVTLLNPPSLSARRRRRPSLIAGIIGDVLGAIFIAVWLGRLLPSYGNETAWWGFIFSIVISVGASYLFFNSGNKILNSGLALVLAIYWGFVGHAFAILINAGVSIPFLPDANIMSFVFFLGALFLHLYLTFTRK